MKFSDLLNPKTGPEALIRLALVPLFILAVGSLVTQMATRLNNIECLLLIFFFILLSPLAYALREQRRGRHQQLGTRRGAERTPLVPHEEEDEE